MGSHRQPPVTSAPMFWGPSPYERAAEPMKRAEGPIQLGQADVL